MEHIPKFFFWPTLREKCPYLELLLSAFSRIQTEYGERPRISPYSAQMQENTDQKNSENGRFLSNKILKGID